MQWHAFTPRRGWERLGFSLFPGICVLCASSSDLPMDLCRACAADLPWNQRACPRCAVPIVASHMSMCGACLGRAPPQTRAIAALRYERDVPDMVTALKFGRSLVHGRILARLMTVALRDAYAGSALPDLLMPVPLSTRRLILRGHNQAGVLARRLGCELGMAVDYDTCRRVRHTQPQAGQSRAGRLRNLRGAFALVGPVPASTIAIVDAVMTTGTTVRTIARLLLGAGAAEVHVWAAARTTMATAK